MTADLTRSRPRSRTHDPPSLESEWNFRKESEVSSAQIIPISFLLIAPAIFSITDKADESPMVLCNIACSDLNAIVYSFV
ncbi:hypothetical protein AVEN_92314-1 [Araneus ventricosus]|uniref:Uncharacterized protein n=1 Tax=Araneus ventricosus TaxID=182803 RepID=A0A4Y2AKY7_ARAVE|nr:hypothetical protein AVEN_92314-1 [Araneus ventricosus]